MVGTGRRCPTASEGALGHPPPVTANQEPTDMIIKPSNEPTLLRRPQVEQRTGLSRSSLYEYIKDGRFPPPVPLGPRAVGWLESEVSDWINARVKLARQSRTPAPR
jgi:prophage regulatory protein